MSFSIYALISKSLFMQYIFTFFQRSGCIFRLVVLRSIILCKIKIYLILTILDYSIIYYETTIFIYRYYILL